MRYIAFKKINLGDPKGHLLLSTCRCLFAILCNYHTILYGVSQFESQQFYFLKIVIVSPKQYRRTHLADNIESHQGI